MAKRPKAYTAAFKFKVTLESFIQGNVSKVSRQYGINPSQMSKWRDQFTTQGHVIFTKNSNGTDKELLMRVKMLESLIGKKEIEINMLQGYLDFYVPQHGK
jgi:transposase-like protein